MKNFGILLVLSFICVNAFAHASDAEETDSLHLRQLVFVPDSYYWGVQATELTSFQYYTYDVTTADPAKADDSAVMGGTMVREHEHGGMMGYGIKTISCAANYHMIPYTANLDRASYELLSADREYTRSATKADALLSITSTSVKDGHLTVYLDAKKPELIKNVPTHQALTFFAVQATIPGEGKTDTIVSDYATLYTSNIKDFVINYSGDYDYIEKVKNNICHGNTYYKYGNSELGWDCDHLFATEDELVAACKEAAEKDASFSGAEMGQYIIGYNAKFDLSKLVETHYTDEYGTHMLMTDAKFESYGVKYKFELVGNFIDGDNQSAYASIEDGMFCPHDSAGIGKTPVVRVSLVDAKTGDVYDYGYIMIQIGKYDATAVNGLEIMENSNSRNMTTGIYNLNGQKVKNPTKGLYIINGKKVLR